MSDNEIFKKLSIGEMPWLSKATCRNEEIIESDLFFAQRRIFFKEALKICQICPVKEQCLDYVLKIPHNEDHYGVMGGTTRNERKHMR